VTARFRGGFLDPIVPFALAGFVGTILVGLVATCLVFLSTVLAARSWSQWLEFSLSAVLAHQHSALRNLGLIGIGSGFGWVSGMAGRRRGGLCSA